MAPSNGAISSAQNSPTRHRSAPSFGTVLGATPIWRNRICESLWTLQRELGGWRMRDLYESLATTFARPLVSAPCASPCRFDPSLSARIYTQKSPWPPRPVILVSKISFTAIRSRVAVGALGTGWRGENPKSQIDSKRLSSKIAAANAMQDQG